MLQPLFARVLLEREVATKIGSILMPKTTQMKFASLKAKVLAIGPDVNDAERTNTVINVGDTVIVGKHAGSWLDDSGQPADDADKAKYYIVADEDILCVVPNEG